MRNQAGLIGVQSQHLVRIEQAEESCQQGENETTCEEWNDVFHGFVGLSYTEQNFIPRMTALAIAALEFLRIIMSESLRFLVRLVLRSFIINS